MERNQGLDLLRLLAGLAVVMLHYNYGIAFKIIDGVPYVNRMILYAMEALSIPAVNIFLLISGFFLYRSEKRCLGKILNLFIFAVFVNETLYFIENIGRYPITVKNVVQGLIPRYYFIILYSVVYLLSPYINLFLRQLTTKATKTLVLILLILLSIEPWVIDLFDLMTNLNFRGMSMISFEGGSGGQNLVHFMLMYVLGASLNKLPLPNIRTALWGYLVSTLIIFISYILRPWGTLVTYYSPYVIAQSVCLIILFMNIKSHTIYLNHISKLSTAAFACYIIHGQLLYHIRIDYFVLQSWYLLLLHIILSLVCIYLFSFIFKTLYDFLFRKPKSIINRINFDYSISDGTSKDNTITKDFRPKR